MVGLRLQAMKAAESTSSIMIQGDSSIPCLVCSYATIYGLFRNVKTSLGLVKPVRAVAFSPGGKLLAAAGDSKLIALYDVSSGEQVANLTGHGGWVFSLDWSNTGEYLLSG